ncbi:MAG: hypothetical protein QGF59_26140, partial [Pirellulaceae bacterium]|nr:hypothetical protein [Pirellulaceae bacterium]
HRVQSIRCLMLIRGVRTGAKGESACLSDATPCSSMKLNVVYLVSGVHSSGVLRGVQGCVRGASAPLALSPTAANAS